jgi:hypothetical protein
MDDKPHHNPSPRWLHYGAACDYLDLKRGTLAKKLAERTGPRFYLSPGSRSKIFWTPDLDDWVRDAPRRELTQAEIKRFAKLQAGAARARERRRSREATEISGSMTV